MNVIEERFLSQVQQLSDFICLNEKQYSQLQIYYKNLIEWNKVMNLTTITEEKDVYEKHFLDSLSLVKLLPSSFLNHNVPGNVENNSSKDGVNPSSGVNISFNTIETGKIVTEHQNPAIRLIDIGTGAGFPGLVLAIVFPDWRITLVDSLNKRLNFLQDTISKLSLNNVETVHARAEELARKKQYREQYDYVVSRAVANLSTLCEYDLPFARIGGSFVAYKSEKGEEELKNAQTAINLLGGKVNQVVNFDLPATNYQRCLIQITKVKHTPEKYPRKAGTPSKEPLQ